MKQNDLFDLLSDHVDEFKKWIAENFTPDQITEGHFDDAGYPKWDKIEDLLEQIFKEIEFNNVNSTHIDKIIYMIARNWDLGSILNWLTKDNNLSQLGMTEEQFLIIAKLGISSEWDARYQIASLLSRVSPINKEKAIDLALKYYNDESEFVRRKALVSLYKLNYFNIYKLIEKSWLNNEEYERMVCLYLMKEVNTAKYNDYLNESLIDDRSDLRAHAESLSKGVGSWSI